jgi:hypothetical protein
LNLKCDLLVSKSAPFKSNLYRYTTYWTSDLWHISSSGEAPGCDQNLRDGNGTDASAFYKEGSRGHSIYTRDGSCHEVDEWGNPVM